jgi:hypothetical protein
MALKAAVRDAHQPELLDRHHAEQAAVEDRLELDKPDGLHSSTTPTSRRGSGAGRTQGQRHRPEGGGEALGARLETIGGRRRRRAAFLMRHFGKSFGAWMHAAAHGRERAAVVTASEPESIAARPPSTATARGARPRRARYDIHDCARSSPATVEERLRGEAIGIKLRFDDFRTATRPSPCPHTLGRPRDPAGAGQCLSASTSAGGCACSGVRASALRKVSELVGGAATPAPLRARETERPVRPRAPPLRRPRPGRRSIDHEAPCHHQYRKTEGNLPSTRCPACSTTTPTRLVDESTYRANEADFRRSSCASGSRSTSRSAH